jgi:ADP-ribosylation factor-like protein 2
VLANKQDLPGALSMPEIAEFLELDALCGSGSGGGGGSGGGSGLARHWQIQACSAVTGGGLVDGIGWIVGDVASRIFVLE